MFRHYREDKWWYIIQFVYSTDVLQFFTSRGRMRESVTWWWSSHPESFYFCLTDGFFFTTRKPRAYSPVSWMSVEVCHCVSVNTQIWREKLIMDSLHLNIVFGAGASWCGAIRTVFCPSSLVSAVTLRCLKYHKTGLRRFQLNRYFCVCVPES